MMQLLASGVSAAVASGVFAAVVSGGFDAVSSGGSDATFELGGLTIQDKTVNGITMNNGILSANTISSSNLSGVDGADITFTGGVRFDNGTLTSGSEGFDIEGVFFKDSKI